jgi:hypothetical protein
MMSRGTLQKPDWGIPPETLQQRSYTPWQAGNPPEMLPVPLRDLKTLSRQAVRACSSGPGSCLYTSAWGHTSSSQDTFLIPGTGLQGWLSTSVRSAGSKGPPCGHVWITPVQLQGAGSVRTQEDEDIVEIEGGGGEGMRTFS